MMPICSGQVNIFYFKISHLLLTLVRVLRFKYNTAKQKLFCGFNTHNQNGIRNVTDSKYQEDTFIASIIIYYNVLYVYYYNLNNAIIN